MNSVTNSKLINDLKLIENKINEIQTIELINGEIMLESLRKNVKTIFNFFGVEQDVNLFINKDDEKLSKILNELIMDYDFENDVPLLITTYLNNALNFVNRNNDIQKYLLMIKIYNLSYDETDSETYKFFIDKLKEGIYSNHYEFMCENTKTFLNEIEKEFNYWLNRLKNETIFTKNHYDLNKKTILSLQKAYDEFCEKVKNISFLINFINSKTTLIALYNHLDTYVEYVYQNLLIEKNESTPNEHKEKEEVKNFTNSFERIKSKINKISQDIITKKVENEIKLFKATINKLDQKYTLNLFLKEFNKIKTFIDIKIKLKNYSHIDYLNYNLLIKSLYDLFLNEDTIYTDNENDYARKQMNLVDCLKTFYKDIDTGTIINEFKDMLNYVETSYLNMQTESTVLSDMIETDVINNEMNSVPYKIHTNDADEMKKYLQIINQLTNEHTDKTNVQETTKTNIDEDTQTIKSEINYDHLDDIKKIVPEMKKYLDIMNKIVPDNPINKFDNIPEMKKYLQPIYELINEHKDKTNIEENDQTIKNEVNYDHLDDIKKIVPEMKKYLDIMNKIIPDNPINKFGIVQEMIKTIPDEDVQTIKNVTENLENKDDIKVSLTINYDDKQKEIPMTETTEKLGDKLKSILNKEYVEPYNICNEAIRVSVKTYFNDIKKYVVDTINSGNTPQLIKYPNTLSLPGFGNDDEEILKIMDDFFNFLKNEKLYFEFVNDDDDNSYLSITN